MKVELSRSVSGQKLLAVLEEAVRDQGGIFEINKKKVGGETVLVLGSVREEIRGECASVVPLIRLPVVYQDRLLKASHIDLRFYDPIRESMSGSTSFGAPPVKSGLKEEHEYRIVEMEGERFIEGERTPMARRLSWFLVCIPIVGWGILANWHELWSSRQTRILSDFPQTFQEQVKCVYVTYLERVGDLLKSSEPQASSV